MFAHIPYHRNQKWILQSFSLISVPHLPLDGFSALNGFSAPPRNLPHWSIPTASQALSVSTLPNILHRQDWYYICLPASFHNLIHYQCQMELFECLDWTALTPIPTSQLWKHVSLLRWNSPSWHSLKSQQHRAKVKKQIMWFTYNNSFKNCVLDWWCLIKTKTSISHHVFHLFWILMDPIALSQASLNHAQMVAFATVWISKYSPWRL